MIFVYKMPGSLGTANYSVIAEDKGAFAKGKGAADERKYFLSSQHAANL